MTYAENTAGRAHAVTYELRIGSGRRELRASTASGASLPLRQVRSVGASLDPISGRRTLAGVNIEVLNTPAMLQIMGPAHTVQTALREAAGPAEATLRLVVGGVNALNAALGALPWDLQVGAESVRATAANAVTDELTVTRAMGAAAPPAGMVDPYETLAQYHPGGSPLGYQPQVWVGRPMTLFGIYDDGTEAALAWYACDDLPSYQDGLWSFPCQDLLGLYNVPLGRGIGELTTDSGGHYIPSERIRAEQMMLIGERYVAEDTVAGRYQMVPYRWVAEDDQTEIDLFYQQGMALGLRFASPTDPNRPFLYSFGTGGIDRRRVQPEAQRIDGGRRLRPSPYAWGRGFDDALLQLITSRFGDGANGAYDILPGNLQAQQGAGLPLGRVDHQSFIDFFVLTESTRVPFDPGELLLDVLERELAWRRYFITIDTATGFLRCRKIEAPVHLDAVDSTVSDAGRLATQPDALILAGRHVGQITVKLGWDSRAEKHETHLVCPGQEGPASSLGEVVTFEPRSIPTPSLDELDAHEQELIALKSEYGVRHPLFREEQDYRAHQTQIGDIAGVNHPRLPAGDGTLGLHVPGLVTSTEIDLEQGVVTLEVEAIGVGRAGYIAPAGIIQVVVGGGGVFDLKLDTAALSDLTSGLDEGGTDADEAEYFAVGWRVRGYAADTGVTAWVADINSVTGPVLNVTVVGIATPAPGEILTVNTYGAFGPTPTNRPSLDQRRPGLLPSGLAPGYAYLADANAELGAANDAAMEWVPG